MCGTARGAISFLRNSDKQFPSVAEHSQLPPLPLHVPAALGVLPATAQWKQDHRDRWLP